MFLYANGCSMTYGAELAEDTKTLQCLDDDYRLEKAWPGQLSKMMDVDHCNGGIGSASNEKILRTTINWVSKYLVEGRDPAELFVVIGWTSVHRIEIKHRKNWIDILPHYDPPNKELKDITRFYNEKIIDEAQDNIRFINQILLLQSWFEKNQIPYLFFSALHQYISQYQKHTEPQLQLIDKVRYFNLMDYYSCMFSFSKKYPIAPRSHPLEEGHYEWAKLLYGHITDNDLLN